MILRSRVLRFSGLADEVPSKRLAQYHCFSPPPPTRCMSPERQWTKFTVQCSFQSSQGCSGGCRLHVVRPYTPGVSQLQNAYPKTMMLSASAH